MILTAGPFDYSWHLKFGLDGLLSPPHLTLLSGWLLIAVGNLRIVNLHLERIRGRPEKVIDHGNGISHSDGVSAGSSVSSDNGSGGKDSGGSGISRDDDKKDGNKVRGDFGTPHERNKLYSKARLYKIQLFLNLSILLMILSGILYFFSLPFSETQSYNFNPPPLLALFVYGLGFPILFSTYFIKILSRYPDMKTIVPLVGTFYVAITLVTQISSNPFLSGYSGYYLLNIVPFGLFYFASRCYYYYRRSNRNSSRSSGKENLKFLNSEKKNFIRFRLPFKYCILGIVFAVLSYSLCFPLNTYVYNEELYGYLIYQNLVVKVYQEIFSENFMIILPMSVAGGCIGYGILLATSSKVRLNHDSH